MFTISNQVATPTFSPLGGIYVDPQSVYISCSTPGSTIYYKDDGTTPSQSSIQYTNSPIYIDSDKTLKAIAYKTGYTTSEVGSATYIIGTTGGNLLAIGPNGRDDHRGVIQYLIGNDLDYTYDGNLYQRVGTGDFIGGHGTNHKARLLLQWNLPDNIIPDDAEIVQAQLQISAYNKLNPPYIKLVSVNINFSTDYKAMWNEPSRGIDVETGIDFSSSSYWQNSYSSNSTFVTQLKNKLPSNRFQLVLVSQSESINNKWVQIDLSNTYLTIWFKPPSRTVTFRNNLNGTYNVGQIKVDSVWQQSPFTQPYRWGTNLQIEATAYNNSRKIAKWQSSLWFAVYESDNIIWFTKSTDAGQTWSKEIPISDFQNAIYPARNPAIAVTSTGVPHVVWEIYKDGGYRVMYRYNYYGLWSNIKDLTPDQLLISYPSSINEQTPSIAAGDVVVVVWSHNGHLAFAIDPENPNSQSFGGGEPYNLGTVAFPSISSSNLSLFDIIWSEGTNRKIFLQTIMHNNITGSVTFSEKINLVSSYTFLSDCNNPSICVTEMNKYIAFSTNDNRYAGGTTRSINYLQILKSTNTIVDYKSWGQPGEIYDNPSLSYNYSSGKVNIVFNDVTNKNSMWIDNSSGSIPRILQKNSYNPLTIENDNANQTYFFTSGTHPHYIN